MRTWGLNLVLTGAFIVALPLLAGAQNVSPGIFEVSGSVGITGGLSDLAGLDALGGVPVDPGTEFSDLSDTKWHVGGGVAGGLTENVLLRFDVTRTGLFSMRVDMPTAGEFVEVDTSLLEFTGGIEYVWDRTPFAPFVGAGGGIARIGANVGANVAGTTFDVGVSDSGGTYNLGAGLRAFLNERLGLRPQVQFVHIAGENFWRGSFGVFYTLN